jgi:putative ABC transport system substrate-binding protein
MGRAELLQSLFAEELVRLKGAYRDPQHASCSRRQERHDEHSHCDDVRGRSVRTGLVASLARPGGNITGYSTVSPELDAKDLSLLRETLPAAQRIGVLVNPTIPISAVRQKESDQVYRSFGMQPIIIAVAVESELENAVAEIARQRAQALVVVDDPLFYVHRVRIMNTARRYSLPTIVEDRDLLEAGGLLCYAFSSPEQDRRVAAFIDKILRGAKPANLPIEQPTKFELIINLKTAKALGITIPQSLLLRADEVIE